MTIYCDTLVSVASSVVVFYVCLVCTVSMVFGLDLALVVIAWLAVPELAGDESLVVFVRLLRMCTVCGFFWTDLLFCMYWVK